MAEHMVAELKALIYNQYIINRKMFMELDNEREASATAATEVLSMVLRLQREKALEMMEACQYRRMTEVKMQHIEECSITLEKLVRQKEMEISVLKGQLNAYKQKLSTFKLNMQVQCGDIITSNSLSEGTRLPHTVRRSNSLPSLRLIMMNLETNGSSNRKPSFQSGPLVWRSTGDRDLITEVGACGSREVKGKKKCELISGSNYYQTSQHVNLWSSEEKHAACLQQSASSTNANTLNSSIQVFWDICLNSETDQENEMKPGEFNTFCNGKLFDPEVDICCLPMLSEQYKQFMDDPVGGTTKTIGIEDFELGNLDNMPLNGAFMHRNCRSKFSSPSKGVSLHQACEVSARTKCDLMDYKPAFEKCEAESSLDQNYIKWIQSNVQYVKDERKLKLSGTKEHLKILRKLYEQAKTIKHGIDCDKPSKCRLNDETKVAYIMEMHCRHSSYNADSLKLVQEMLQLFQKYHLVEDNCCSIQAQVNKRM